MGRSAKFHKQQDKKKTSSAGSGPASAHSAAVPHSNPSKPKPKAAVAAPTPREQKKRAGLKDKAKLASARRRDDDDTGPVLGGADYVELMLGGRRKAAAEAAKLPKDPAPCEPRGVRAGGVEAADSDAVGTRGGWYT